jgi:carboxymethylenebutenolidase
MAGSETEIRTRDGDSFGAYLATPRSAGSHPAVVVIQEIFGVNAVMRTTCDRLAATGYIAICPDLFWRQAPGIQLTDKTDADWKRAFELFNGFDVDAGVRDIAATIDHARALPSCSGKVGAVGYCLGGLLAYLTAARTDADCAIGYYGVNIAAMLGEAGNIGKPLLLHVAEEDEFVPKDAQAQVAAGLRGNPLVTIHTYAGQGHAFARDGGQHYDKASADTANARSAAFFARHLSS